MKFKRILNLLEKTDPVKDKELTDEEKAAAEEEKAKKDKEKIPKDVKDKKDGKDTKEDPKEEPDPDKEFSKDKEVGEEEKLQADIDAKFEEIGNEVMTSIKHLLDTKTSVILDKIKNTGIDDTVKDFLDNYFIKGVKDPKDKIFISLNMDELVPYIAQKISVEYLKK